MIKILCHNCKREFEKLKSEITRSIKLKRPIFCGRSCSATSRNKKMTDKFWKNQYSKQRLTFDIKTQASNKKDEFSPFRFFLNTGRASMVKHKHEIDIDVKYLKIIWEKQDGICPYTGIKMILPETTNQSLLVKSLKRASLDRIDSSKGYLKDNVEFVCQFVNNAKNNFTKKETLEFLREIRVSV